MSKIIKKIKTVQGQKVRRDVLKREIEAGKLIGKCMHSYTDDYAYDAKNNNGETDWLPVNLKNTQHDHKEGFVNIWIDNFTGPCYRTYIGDGNLIRLSSTWECFTFKYIEETPVEPPPADKKIISIFDYKKKSQDQRPFNPDLGETETFRFEVEII
jgi:hypothetical protein